MDPICACATPWGHGAVSMVRLSGPALAPLVGAVCGPLPAPRSARLARLRDDAGIFDDGLVLWMPGPRSYTGEDVAEISCHGNPLLVERLLAALVARGARRAQPGEFTRRAFLNGRMDLTRAEAVLQAIRATSPAGLAVARRGLEGEVARHADTVRDALVDLAAELEAALDYPEEGLLLGDDGVLADRARALAMLAEAPLAGARAARLAVDGARVALVGPVNAGKSSLFNALLGARRALVSAAPGTTRDVVESALVLPSMRIQLLDTAGERDGTVTDPVEAAGLALAADLVAEADALLVVLPGHRPLDGVGEAILARTADRPRLVVATHADLPRQLVVPDALAVSAVRGDGIGAVRDALPRLLVGDAPASVTGAVASERQRDALGRVARCAREAEDALRIGVGPAVAVERAYEALDALDALVGRDTREDVLDRLFARFCVGK